MFSRLSKFTLGFSKNEAISVSKLFSIGKLNFSTLGDDFGNAQKKLNQLKNDPGSEIKLKIYALFKQSTEGKCTKAKPSMIDFVAKAKWEAWTSLGEMKKDDAMKEYVSVVNNLADKENVIEDAAKSSESDASPGSEGFKVTNKNGVLTLRLNRPDKKNAITWDMYQFWAKTLREADKNPSVNVVVVTGNGDFFCSGNDLSNFTSALGPNVNPQQMALKGNQVLQDFVGSFIDFGKPLIAAVNGPAIGICVTTLGLYDAVYASDNATFSTPFSNLGQTPEGCSSYTFPIIFGPMKAKNMVMFNEKLSANEAIGLVTKVFPHKVFQEEVAKKINEIASLPPQTLRYAKELLRDEERRALLHKVNKRECDRLQERWLSDECIQAITKFFSKK